MCTSALLDISSGQFYEYIDGGSARRFTPPICPGPGRTCCSNNFPYCGTPASVSIDAKYLGADIMARLKAGHANSSSSSSWRPSPLMALHGWYNLRIHQPWYNLVFGVGAASVGRRSPSGATDSLTLDFDRGGHQSSQGAKTLDNIWLEGDLAFLDSPAEWFHDRATQRLYYALNGTDAEPPAEIVMSALPSLVQVVGSQSSPVKNVALKDLVVERTASNLFAPFEALGGGDQAIERGGAVFAEALTNAKLLEMSWSFVDFLIKSRCLTGRRRL